MSGALRGPHTRKGTQQVNIAKLDRRRCARCSFLFLGEFRYLRPIMFSVVVPASHRDLCELPDAMAPAASAAGELASFQLFVGIKVSSVSFSRTQVRSPPLHRLLLPSRVHVADDYICLSRTVAKWSDGSWLASSLVNPTRQMLILTCHQLMSTSHEFSSFAKARAHVYLIPKNRFRGCRRQTQLLAMDFRISGHVLPAKEASLRLPSPCKLLGV